MHFSVLQTRIVLSAAVLLMLGGSLSAVHAEDAALSAPQADQPATSAPAASVDAELPRFAPSNLESDFAPFADEAAPIEVEEETPDEHIGHGVASYYGARFAGKPTASGERFDPQQLTAAHRTLPFGSLVRVTNPGNGQSVVVRINDRGPFHGNRAIDLSRRAAEQIGIVRAGHGTVRLDLVTG